MKLLQHARIGKWAQGKDGDYFQKLVIEGAKVSLVLNCAYEGPDKAAHNLECCIAIAERVYGNLKKLIAKARRLASRKCLKIINKIRDAEGKPPLSSTEFASSMKLLQVCVTPHDGTIDFSAQSYDDEHSLVTVRFGPRGGLIEAFVE